MHWNGTRVTITVFSLKAVPPGIPQKFQEESDAAVLMQLHESVHTTLVGKSKLCDPLI